MSIHVKEMKSLSLVVFDMFAKLAFWTLDLWPWSKVMAPNESPYIVSYMSLIEVKSLSVMVFKIFAKNAFWLLDLWLRSKVVASNGPYMVSYMTIIKKYLYLSLFSRYLRKKHFDLLTLGKGQRSWHQMKAHIWSSFQMMASIPPSIRLSVRSLTPEPIRQMHTWHTKMCGKIFVCSTSGATCYIHRINADYVKNAESAKNTENINFYKIIGRF